MIISRTPYRISFFGGGTDFPAWYEEHGGAVLAAAINRYCYISCRLLPPFFGYRHRIVYSQIEIVNRTEDIRHPAVRECLSFLAVKDGIEVHHDGDLPKQTGLGTSSSFAVGLLNALHALKGEMTSSEQLASEATRVERDLCGDNVGSQDQVTAAYGGLNLLEFKPGGIVDVHPVTISVGRLEEFQRSLMLVFTGFARTSSEIAAEQLLNIPQKGRELREMRAMVDEGVRILAGNGDLRDFGRLLNEGWKLKRSLSSKISNNAIDGIYDRALKAGATGGKLCGAGGGGFVLLFVEPDRRDAVVGALGDLLHVPFEFDWMGTQIIVYQPETGVKK